MKNRITTNSSWAIRFTARYIALWFGLFGKVSRIEIKYLKGLLNNRNYEQFAWHLVYQYLSQSQSVRYNNYLFAIYIEEVTIDFERRNGCDYEFDDEAIIFLMNKFYIVAQNLSLRYNS